MPAKIDENIWLGRLRSAAPEYQFHAIEGRKAVAECAIHGVWRADKFSFLAGHGCRPCRTAAYGISRQKDFAYYQTEARKVHGDAFFYEGIEHRGPDTWMQISCAEHGLFELRAYNHISQKQGCPECRGSRIAVKLLKDVTLCIKEAQETHKSRYSYTGQVVFRAEPGKRRRRLMEIKCETHGLFYQTPYDHIGGQGCPKCGVRVSNWHLAVSERLRAFAPDLVDEFPIAGKFADILIPLQKTIIELNGNRWHSEKFREGRQTHLDRSRLFAEAGYRTIHVWEHEQGNTALNALLDGLAGKPQIALNARDCKVSEISKKEAFAFHDQNHMQGRPSPIAAPHIGLLHPLHGLVAVMSFQSGSARRGKGFQTADWELVRYSTLIDHRIRGGASKLFKRRPEGTISSLSDNRFFEGKLYETLGFARSREYRPDYFYTTGAADRVAKQSMQKRDIARKYGIDPTGKTEREMAQEAGFWRVWDCGKTLWLYGADHVTQR